MARLTRLAVPGCVHHVLQRGIDHRPIFADAEDFRAMLSILRDLARAESLAIHAYALLPGAFQLLLTAEHAQGLSRAMQALGRRYVRRFNRLHRRTGPLWEGRFRSTVVDPESHLVECMRHVETAPQRAGLVADAATYPWSSVGHHLGVRNDPLIEDHQAFWALGNTPFERQAAYARLVAMPLDADQLARIDHATQRGWPLGGAKFAEVLEARTGRRMVPNPVGRPRRASTSAPARVNGG
jgi:putative transposase